MQIQRFMVLIIFVLITYHSYKIDQDQCNAVLSSLQIGNDIKAIKIYSLNSDFVGKYYKGIVMVNGCNKDIIRHELSHAGLVKTKVDYGS